MAVTLRSSNGVQLTVDNGDGSPVLSNGISTWDTVARPKRQSVTRYTGRTPFSQDIPVMFDGYADGTSQEGAIAKLVHLSSQPNDIKLSGHALKTDLSWVIQDITWDATETIWKPADPHPVRVRQAATIHLLEYIKETILKTPAAPSTSSKKNGKAPVKKVKTPKGMTAKQIAQIEFHDPDKWHKIYDDNPWLGAPSPRRIIPAGTELVILDGSQPAFTVP